ncbi:hypothetical protein [Pseudomonas sp. S2_F03]
MSSNPNGTYKGRVYDSGESNDATLTITSSDSGTGNVTGASMTYYGLNFVVDGTFAYQNLTGESPVSFNLRAEVKSGENNLLNITLASPDRNYTTLTGKVYVSRGGPNVGKTYDITFNRT